MGIATPREVSRRTGILPSFPLISNVTPTQICQYNPDRIALFISLPQGLAAGVNVAPSRQVSATLGSQVSQQPIIISMVEQAGLPCVEWFAIASAGNTPIMIIETFYFPPESYTEEEANALLRKVRAGHVATRGHAR